MATVIFGDFEWDDQKSTINLQKHNFAFSVAQEFFKQTVYESPPFLHNGEERKFAVGLVENKSVTVIFCERGRKRRIISIRRSRDYERDIYRTFIRG